VAINANVIQLHEHTKPEQSDKLMNDLEYLNSTQLRKKYPHEANCHRNLRTRCNGAWNKHTHKTNDCICHPYFTSFASFLGVMGESPSPLHTIDRINPHLKEYSPENCRWANKSTQAINKTNTIVISKLDGSTIYLPELAKQQGITTHAIYQRRYRGWSDNELLQGERDSKAFSTSNTGNKSDWNILFSDPENRTRAEINYQKGRRHIKGYRNETRSEYFFRWLWELQEYCHLRIIENLNGENNPQPEVAKHIEAIALHDKLYDHAKQQWLVHRGKPFSHPRYDKQNHCFRWPTS